MKKPQITTTTHVIDFSVLDPSNFERLCLWLVKEEGYTSGQHFGLVGGDGGRDVTAYKGQDLWYFQCKRYKKVEPSQLTKEVEKVYNFYKIKSQPQPVGIVFVISSSVSAKTRDKVIDFCQDKKYGFQCEFWAQTELDQKVKQHPLILKEFFGLRPSDLASDPEEFKRIFAQLPLDQIPERTNFPSGSKMPYHSHPNFVGRREEMQSLARMLSITAIGRIAVATGLGGIGKTQLAVEFVHRYGQYFAGGVFWLNAESVERMKEEIALCGNSEYLNLYSYAEKLSIEEQLVRVKRAWNEEMPRLLIFDNCEEEAILKEWRPSTGGCRILLTSRRNQWAIPEVQILPLGVFPREKSIEFLQKFRKDLSAEDAATIAAELGDLPLALYLAGSFLKTYQHTSSGEPKVYLQKLRDLLLEHPSLQGRGANDFSPTDHDNHISRTFALSYEKLNPEEVIDNIALLMLTAATFFAHGIAIKRKLLLSTLPSDLNDPNTELDKEDGLQRILALGLLEEYNNGWVHIHRLLALFVQQKATYLLVQQKATYLEMMQWFVEDKIIENAYIAWKTGNPHKYQELGLSDHLQIITDRAMKREDRNAGLLCYYQGTYLQMIGNYSEASRYIEWILKIVKFDSNLEYAVILSCLASLRKDQGEYITAEGYYRQSLLIKESELGKDNIETARTYNNLASTLQNQGRSNEACSIFEHTLTIYKQFYGDNHRETFRVACNLANILLEEERFAEANALIECILKVFEQTPDLDLPDTAQALRLKAKLRMHQKDFDDAQKILEQTLTIDETVYGTNHPKFAMDLHSLSFAMFEQGKYVAAQEHCKRALDIHEKTFGSDHPHTASSLVYLAVSLSMQGKSLEAKELAQRGFAILEEKCGKEHPDTKLAREVLAVNR